MADDWQEAAFSNRHTHNRGGQRGKGGKANSHGFNVDKTFGTYEIKSHRFPSIPEGETKTAKLEVYTLNDQENALIGELFIPGCMTANVLMAGSRKVMKQAIRDLVEKDEPEELDPDEEANGNDAEAQSESEDEEDDSDDEERKERQKAQEFEKNSFRSPKFWMKWQGQLLGDHAGDEILTDGGYIVFSGNACEKFDGTLSCKKPGWKNIKFQGWKTKGMSARDFEIDWLPEDAEQEDKEEKEEEG